MSNSPSYPLGTYVQKSAMQVRDDYLRTVKNGLIGLGIPNPNVGDGSDYYVTGTALGNEIAVVQANSTILADQCMPDTAAGSMLDRWLALFGLSRNPATGAAGVVSIQCSAPATTIVTGQQLVDATGLRFQVTIGGSYGSNTPVPVQAIDTGAATDHANGDVLTWVTAPPYCAQNVTVGTLGGTDGLSGGNDSEVGNDEPPRARLFALLQNPPKGGNCADIAGWAGDSAPEVEATFVYPALMGPGTVFFCCTQAAQTAGTLSATSKERALAATTMTGTVVPYVQGRIPEHAFSCGATVLNQPTDIAIQLALPSAPTASPAGPGGGWIDGTPWPSSIGATPSAPGIMPCRVKSVLNSTTFVVDADGPPQLGVSHIAWLSPINWQLYTAIVVSTPLGATYESGNYTIVVDTPMPGISVGSVIFPQSVNQLTYVAAILAAFAQMGPGEWTTNTNVIARARRYPLPQNNWPYTLGAMQIKAVISSGSEVLDAAWIYQQFKTPNIPAGSPTFDGNGNLTSPPPSILVPNNIGFYAQ